MNLQELEQLSPDGETEEVVCELVQDEDDSTSDLKLKKCVDKLIRDLFGRNKIAKETATKKRVAKLISKELDLEQMDQLDQDLGESLELLESSLFLFERVLSRFPHLLGVELIGHMEEVQEHLEQWGMGSQEPPVQDKQDFLRNLDPDNERD